jgi:hypothetical protein
MKLTERDYWELHMAKMRGCSREELASELQTVMQGFYGAYHRYLTTGMNTSSVFNNASSVRNALARYTHQYSPDFRELTQAVLEITMREAGIRSVDTFNNEEMYERAFYGRVSRNKEVNQKELAFVISQMSQEQYLNTCENVFEKKRKKEEMMYSFKDWFKP